MPFSEYPQNWQEMRDAIFALYGGRYCVKGIFMKFGHEGNINIHHSVPLSKAVYRSEYYFLNSPWNLVPLCEKHHIQSHPHLRYEEIKGRYNYKPYSKSKKISWARRFCWLMKRAWYSRKFENRKGSEKVLWAWNYWESVEIKLGKRMESWPVRCLEDML